jgi:hypothetical protein
MIMGITFALLFMAIGAALFAYMVKANNAE